MKFLKPIESQPLEYYLQLEQELLSTIEEPTFFTWVVAPTVIYGRHQFREQEIDEHYCAAHDIRIVQRQSGGGCVYADRGNLMISFVTPETHSEQVFKTFLMTVEKALIHNGLQAATTEHNDILIDGRKVSGWACFTSPKGTIVHGTMLYEVNLDALTRAITPNQEKLNKHGVTSVRQRVANIRAIKDFGSIDDFRELLEKSLNQ